MATAATAALLTAAPAFWAAGPGGVLLLGTGTALAKDGDSGGGRGSDDSGGSRGSDDSGGRGRGGDDSSGRGRGGDDRADRSTGAKVEIEGDRIEVTFADGTKQEIENGRFEQKDAQGRTIVERPATAADRARLGTAVGNAGAPAVQVSAVSGGARVEIDGRGIEVIYADGWKEEIRGGRYQMKDPANNTVVERAAGADDRARLEAALRP